MKEYHKIQSVYMRDPENRHKTFIMGEYAMPEFGYLANLEWEWSEKVDGTNIRVMRTAGEAVSFGGKTDRASIPAKLVDRLRERFGAPDALLPAFPDSVNVCLYGEGYGAGIQSGGAYRQDQDFVLFDILISDRDKCALHCVTPNASTTLRDYASHATTASASLRPKRSPVSTTQNGDGRIPTTIEPFISGGDTGSVLTNTIDFSKAKGVPVPSAEGSTPDAAEAVSPCRSPLTTITPPEESEDCFVPDVTSRSTSVKQTLAGSVLPRCTCRDWWLKRADVEEIAAKLGLDVVPIIGRGTLSEMVEVARAGFGSRFGTAQSEGIVARPSVDLFTRSGERIITKVKYRDFPH